MSAETNTRKITRGFSSILIGTVTNLAILITFTPFIVRLLGEYGYGRYAFFFSLFQIFTSIFNFGLFDGLRKYMAEDQENNKRLNELASAGTFFGVLSLFAFITCYLIAVFISKTNSFINADDLLIYFLLIISIIGFQFFMIGRGILFGQHMEQKSEYLFPIKELIFSVLTVWWLLIGGGLMALFIAQGISYCLIGAICYVTAWKNIDITFDAMKKGLRGFGKSLLKYSSVMFFLTLLSQLLYQIDILMINMLLSEEATAFFKTIMVLSNYFMVVVVAVQTILFHSASNLWAKDRSKIDDLISNAMKYTIILELMISVLMVVLGESFLKLYFGASYAGAFIPLIIILPGIFLFSLQKLISSIILGKGDVHYFIPQGIVFFMLNIVLNYFLLESMDIVGAALTKTIVYSGNTFFFLLLAGKTGFNPVKNIKFVHISLAILPVFGVSFLLSWFIPGQLLQFIVIPAVGFFVYAILLLNLKIITLDEIERIIENLPSEMHAFVKRIYSRIKPIALILILRK
ncbi:oligosaccharide flippase family protein [Candidatus Bathyarchaeota archaeon]|nr:oligosaccharide flippase family protein [Candidatus Bathyarchaeota archaeon]